MHRTTPLMTAFRAFTAGGARSVVDKADDKKLMQEMGGNFMKGETREKVEAPQNYGFTSVVMPATKGKDGQIEDSAEAFINFIGGNRSFPVCGVMDDRRFRLKELEAGDVAFFDHLQHQFHFNKDGGFLTGREDKKLRFQLVEKPQEDQQQGGGGGGGVGKDAPDVAGLAAAAGGTSGQQSGGQKKKGQTARYKKESKKFVDINNDKIDLEHDKAIKHKAPKHTLDGNVVITGELYVQGEIKGGSNLRINNQGFKPSNDLWAAGSAGGPPSADSETGLAEGGGGVESLNAEQLAHLEYKRQVRNRVRIDPDGTVSVDGDFVVRGNLIVTGDLDVSGVVRAKDFVKVE